jgi:RimJ/RimL family protein N-acetyltransferase
MSADPVGVLASVEALTFLETPRLTLRPLCPEDASEAYLSWLNDPEVLRFRGPKAFPSTMEDLQRYLASLSSRGDLALAIFLKEGRRHIGNITLNTILWVHRSAELSMMIGEKDVWGRKLGQEAIHAVCRHAFETMGLHRLWAESPNPAFNGAVKALGWTHEGTKRQAFLLDGALVDIECYAILRSEFVVHPVFEART